LTATTKIQDLIAATGADPAELARKEALHLAVQEGASSYIPLIGGAALTPEQEAVFPGHYPVNEEYYSDEKTLVNGLRGAAGLLNSGADATPAIRANLGTGIGATPFGAVNTVFEDKMPWITEHVALTDLDGFDAETCPLGEVAGTALARSRYLAEALEGSGITPFCFDLQSPFDLAHLVIGDEIFYALYDEPERVHRLLDNCTRMLIRLTTLYKEATGEALAGGRHGVHTMKGGIRVCEDTTTLLGEEQIQEFAVPYTRRALQAFGGGFVHYCGRNEHLYRAVIHDMPEAHALNFGNCEMHDMEAVIADCLATGKTYIGAVHRQAEESTEDYFRRVLSYTQGTGRGLVLQLGRLERDDAELWRELQAG
jgi:hypothetical protein